MIYYGPRMSRYYLHQLECCRRSPVRHNIVTVAGGCGWLHAVGRMTRSIAVVDVDPDTIDFNDAVIALIRKTESFEIFKLRLAELIGNTEHIVWERHGLQEGYFYWHLGQSNLAEQDHYSDIREKLLELAVVTRVANLAEYYFAPLNDAELHVLLSNADGPIGNRCRDIIPHILETVQTRTTIVTWLHTIRVEPNLYKRSYDNHCDL